MSRSEDDPDRGGQPQSVWKQYFVRTSVQGAIIATCIGFPIYSAKHLPRINHRAALIIAWGLPCLVSALISQVGHRMNAESLSKLVIPAGLGFVGAFVFSVSIPIFHSLE
jgi:TctA family transporter